MGGLRHTSGLHLDRQCIVVGLANPLSVRGDCRILHDLAGRDRPEAHRRNGYAIGKALCPGTAPGEVTGNLIRFVRDFPGAGARLESIVLTGTTVIGVDVGRDHHIAQLDVGPESAGDTYEQQGERIELGDRALREHCRGLVSLADQP